MDTTQSASYQLPDLVGLCGDSFELRTNPHCRDATLASLQWAEAQGLFDEEMKDVVPRFQIGLLASLAFPTCDYPQLKLVMDCFLYAVFSGLQAGTAYTDIWLRLQRTTSEAWQADFLSKLHALRDNLSSDVQHDATLEKWLEFKRHASGFLLCLSLIEYASGLDVHERLRNSPQLQEITRRAADTLVWMDEMASYNVRQAKGDRRSLIAVLSAKRNLSVQSAMNAAADEMKKAIVSFLALEGELSNVADGDARRYTQGLRDWIIGFAHWVYETDAHFLGHGEDVRAFGWVFLLPKSDTDPIEQWISELKKSSRTT